MTDFTLHERLAADTVELVRWPLSLVLLMKARQWPWLILVPRRPAIREVYELPDADQQVLMAEIARASRRLAQLVRPDKINVAALGNQVAQLHIHIVARHKTDPGWPGSPWVAGDPVPYAPGAAEEFLKTLRARL